MMLRERPDVDWPNIVWVNLFDQDRRDAKKCSFSFKAVIFDAIGLD